METGKLKRFSKYEWHIEPVGKMNVPVIIYADEHLIEQMDEKVCQQAVNVASLPGIVKASFAMPDAHWGYGFPIGGVAAFDANEGGVISAGGVGFDIACGVRTLKTNLTVEQIESEKTRLADLLARRIPAGVGSTGKLLLNRNEMDKMLAGGAQWAVEKGYGTGDDLKYIEENGRMAGAKPGCVSEHAKKRQERQVGTLGSGNHYLELQKVTRIYNNDIGSVFSLKENDIVISVHCGSRGLGHQIGTEFLKEMVKSASNYGISLPERELACAPIDSTIGRKYFGAMNAGVNCALANRQVLTDLIRKVFSEVFGESHISLLYDVSHNTCKTEEHEINGKLRKLYVHRKGATRAFGPGHPSLPEKFSKTGQPVLIGGTMGTASYILAGTDRGMSQAFGSCCHGAGRAMSRTAAMKRWHGKDIVRHLAQKNIVIRGVSLRGIAEEAPAAYKDVDAVVNATEKANLAKKVARLEPLICIKG